MNLQKLLYAISETWNFSVSMNISTHIYNLYLYIRTLLFLSCEIRNFHLLAIPIFSFHNGEEIYSHAEKAMYVIFPNWKYIIVSISIDGKINMTNRVKGVATIFKNIKNWIILPLVWPPSTWTLLETILQETHGHGVILSADWSHFILANVAEPNQKHGQEFPKNWRHTWGVYEIDFFVALTTSCRSTVVPWL